MTFSDDSVQVKMDLAIGREGMVKWQGLDLPAPGSSGTRRMMRAIGYKNTPSRHSDMSSAVDSQDVKLCQLEKPERDTQGCWVAPVSSGGAKPALPLAMFWGLESGWVSGLFWVVG